jgi:hypothetical protein
MSAFSRSRALRGLLIRDYVSGNRMPWSRNSRPKPLPQAARPVHPIEMNSHRTSPPVGSPRRFSDAGAAVLILAAVCLCLLLPRSPGPRGARGGSGPRDGFQSVAR